MTFLIESCQEFKILFENLNCYKLESKKLKNFNFILRFLSKKTEKNASKTIY